MSTTAQQPVSVGVSARGVNPVLAASVIALVPVAIARIKFSALSDPDTFWHILGGRNALDAHSVAGPDPIGHFATNDWVQTDWLTQVVMAAVDRGFGTAGVAWLFLGLYVAVFFGIYAECRQRAGILVSGLVGGVAWLGTTASLTPRPQVVSFVLLTITVVVWHRALGSAEGARSRVPWVLVPLTWVWASCHGMWFLGPVTGLALLAGTVLDKTLDRRAIVRLALVPLASLVAAAVTPIGPKLLITPLTVNAYAGFAQEWSPADIHQPFVAATVALLALTAMSWAVAGRRATWTDVVTWLMALGWVLLYSRTVAVGAILVAPLAAQAIQPLLRRDKDPVGRAEPVLLAAAASVTLLLAALVGPSTPLGDKTQPTGLSTALRALPADTVVLDDDAFGGWLELTQPQLRVVLDTRTTIYSPDYLKRYLDARAAGPGWQDFVESTHAEAALLRSTSPLAVALQERLGWTVVATSDGVVLLRPGSPVS